jgi:hypothetical protein
MKKALFATLTTLFISLNLFGQADSVRKSPLDLPFDTLLAKCELDFKMPSDFGPTDVKNKTFYQLISSNS